MAISFHMNNDDESLSFGAFSHHFHRTWDVFPERFRRLERPGLSTHGYPKGKPMA